MIIDNLTGEVIEQEETNLVGTQNMNAVCTEEIMDLFEKQAILNAQLKDIEYKLKKAFIEQHDLNGLKSYENDYIKMTYRTAFTSTRVDTEKVKDYCKFVAGADWEKFYLENFAKSTYTGGSVVLKYKEA